MADKCKWYAEFEGACTNGKCPVCADTCLAEGELGICVYDEPKTRVFDQFRTPEDLAELLSMVTCCDDCPIEDMCQTYVDTDTCAELFRDWLNSKPKGAI